jgi:WD40-like Beta Propeller Repeat
MKQLFKGKGFNRILALGLLAFSLTFQAEAQNKKAKDYYKRYGYQYALEAMDRTELSQVKKDSLEKYLLMKASSHKMTGDYATASRYYQELAQLTEKADYKLLSGQMLVSMGSMEEAMDYFKAFDMQQGEADKRGKNWLSSSDKLLDGSFPVYAGIELRNAPFNSGAFDGQAIVYKNGYIFSSNRESRRDVFAERVDIWTKTRFFDLWQVERKEGKDSRDEKFKMATPLKGKVNTKFHDSYHTFMPGQKTMLFTRDLFTGKKRFYDTNKYTRLGIFSAQQDGDRWDKVESLPFNNQEFTHAHPALSHDGMKLYFTSNRPGGYGGMDLYVSRYRGGVWTAPENLGPDVNTAGNELFPFIHKDGTLYFASDGHGGLGGLDIFRTKAKADLWEIPSNIGSPINSNKDDFAFILEADSKTGSLTSNREGGRGGDDIYLFKIEKALQEAAAQDMYVYVYDRKTGKRLSEVPVNLTADGEENVY